MSKMLATIMLDVPIDLNEEDLIHKTPDFNTLKSLFEQLEFKTLAQRVFTDFSKKKEVPLPDLFASLENKNEEKTENSVLSIYNTPHDYQLIQSYDELKKLAHSIQPTSLLCFDTETDGLDLINVRMLGLSISIEPNKAYYIQMPASTKKPAVGMNVLKTHIRKSSGIEDCPKPKIRYASAVTL